MRWHMPITAIDDLTGSALLDEVDALAEAQRLGEVRQFAWRRSGRCCVVRSRSTLSRRSFRVASGCGSTAAPARRWVGSFAGAEFGARMGRSTYAGDMLIADALDLQFRCPRLWARVEAGEVRASYARHVARRPVTCPPTRPGWSMPGWPQAADGRITWSRFTALVEAAIIAADPEAAAEREAQAAVEKFARTTRSRTHGMAGMYLRTDVAGIVQLDAMVSYLAEALAALGSTAGLDERRAMAMVILANPAQAVRLLAEYSAWRERPTDADQPTCDDASVEDPAETEASSPVTDAVELFARCGGTVSGDRPVLDWSALLPKVTLFVHLYQPEPGQSGAAGSGVTRIEGVGSVSETWLREHLPPALQGDGSAGAGPGRTGAGRCVGDPGPT